MRRAFIFFFIPCIFFIASAYAQVDTNNITCLEMERYNSAHADTEAEYKMDIKEFALLHFQSFENKYPNKDISEFKTRVMNWPESFDNSVPLCAFSRSNPFVFLLWVACDKNSLSNYIYSNDKIAVRIEKELLAYHRRSMKSAKKEE